MNTNLLSISVGLLALTAGFSSSLHACGLPQLSLDALSGRAVSENKAVSAAAIAQLRATGPQGLDVLLKGNAAAISRHENPSKVIAGANQERLAWVRLTRALDAVSGRTQAPPDRARHRVQAGPPKLTSSCFTRGAFNTRGHQKAICYQLALLIDPEYHAPVPPACLLDQDKR
jgi:hypothetical protein